MLSKSGELVSLGLSDRPEVLIGREQRRDLESLPDFLPAACTMAGFECRLDKTQQVDIGLCLQQSKSFAGMGHPWDCEHTLPDRLAAFIDQWTSHDSLLRDNVDCIWLGFDRTGSSAADFPFVYFAPSLGAVSFAPRDDDLIEQVVREGLELLEPGVHEVSHALIRRALDTLPDRGEILLAASLYQRGVPAVRLELRMPTGDLVDFLGNYGWPGDYRWLQDTLSALDAHAWHMPLQVEVSDQVLPTLSLEFPVLPQDIDHGQWEHLLDRFISLGYCLPEKGAAVRHWLNQHTDANDRQLDLKIRHNGHGKVVAKAYLVVEDTLSFF